MVDLSLIFSPSNGILGHTSHYQSIPVIRIDIHQQRAVFAKQLKQSKVEMRRRRRLEVLSLPDQSLPAGPETAWCPPR